jgi:hypothetical protein
MSLVFLIYLAGVITSISKLIGLVFAATIVCYTIYAIAYVAFHDTLKGLRTWPIALILGAGIIQSLLPSERTMWMMAGAYTGQQIVESTIGKQTVELIELKLAEELEVLKSKAKEKTK